MFAKLSRCKVGSRWAVGSIYILEGFGESSFCMFGWIVPLALWGFAISCLGKAMLLYDLLPGVGCLFEITSSPLGPL